MLKRLYYFVVFIIKIEFKFKIKVFNNISDGTFCLHYFK